MKQTAPIEYNPCKRTEQSSHLVLVKSEETRHGRL